MTGSGNEDRTGCGSGCSCRGNEFGDDTARRELRGYREKGPDETTRWLIDALRGGPGSSIDGATVLDVGAGVGAVHLELLRAGAVRAVDVDGSPAYLAASREEAARQGVDDRVEYLDGDVVALADRIEPADLVALDRVVCCYPDMRALLGVAAARTQWRIGL